MRTIVLGFVALHLVACADRERGVPLVVTSGQEVSLDAGASLVITIYGYDPHVIDVAPTFITRWTSAVRWLPDRFDLTLPGDAVARIDQGFGPVDEALARFSLGTTFLDVDGDGRICAGDLTQANAGYAPISFPAVGYGPLAVPMVPVDGTGPCVDLETLE
jgi:hypothetical protein